MNKSISIFCQIVFVIWAVASASATAAVDPLVGDKEVILEGEASAKGFRRSINYPNAPDGEQDPDVPDARGGSGTLLLELPNRRGESAGGFQVPFGDIPLPAGKGLSDVQALGSMAFDYKLVGDLGGQEVAFKIYCNDKTNLLTAFTPVYSPEGNDWVTRTFDFNDAEFRGGKGPGTLAKHIEDGWCTGKFKPNIIQEEQDREVSELLIAAGANNVEYAEQVKFYIDYIRVGTDAKTYDFDLPDEQGFDEAPKAPVDLAATPGDGEAVISFTQPDGDVTVDNYSYSYSIDGDNYTDYTPLDPADNSTSITIKPLTNNTTYSIKLRSLHINENNEQIASVPSDAVSNITPVATKILPNAPIINFIEPGNQQVKIFFTQPPKTGESAVEDYIMRVGGDGGQPTGQTESPITVNGGENGSTYTISIAAENADGPGPDSNQVTVTLPADTDGDGVPDPNDACPNDPTCTSLPVPTLPWPALLALLSLVGWYGRRRLMS